jgi:ATP-dependent helicase HrpA
MREWRDIHAQLLDVLRERDDFKPSSVFDAAPTAPPPRGRAAGEPADPLAFGTAAYRAIHRSILAGLIGNIAHLDEENGGYKATHDRRVVLFPGSVLARRDDAKKKKSNPPAPDRERARTPRWIVASEIMETSRLYARTCARVDPAWALELGAHLVRVSHSEPFWNAEAGRVMVKQRTRLYGLELERRSVGYGRIDPAHATEIFIREGLVNDTIAFPLDFLAHNRTVREKLADLLSRTRDRGFLNLDEAAFRFYAARLENVSSVAELVDLVRRRRGAEPRFLMMSPDDLRETGAAEPDATAFPEALPLDNRALPLNYAYKPGQADDGVTLEIGVREAAELTPAALDWAVPGHLEAKVEHYLRTLPKELRRAFVPLTETARSLAAQVAARDRLTGRRETLPEALAAQIAERFQVAIDPAVWADKPLPDHLRVRVRVLDAKGRELCASRELAEIDAALHQHKRDASATIAQAEPETWRRARARWETAESATWVFGDMPARVLVTEQAGVPVFAFPGLRPGRDGVALRLFKTETEAREASRRGLAALLEQQLGHELGWLERDLRALKTLGPLIATLAPADELQAQAFGSLRQWLCDPGQVQIHAGDVTLAAAAFAAAVDNAKSALRGLVPRLVDLLREILTLRQELLVLPKPYPGLERDLAALVGSDFLRTTPYPRLAHLPRYLKAMKLRADRFRQNPARDAERAAQLAPYLAAAERVRTRDGGDAFRWLVEEFRVSLFAQELGTAEPVSAVKLDRALGELDARPAATSAPSMPRPIVAAPVAEKKPAPVKSLGALDRLFSRG